MRWTFGRTPRNISRNRRSLAVLATMVVVLASTGCRDEQESAPPPQEEASAEATPTPAAEPTWHDIDGFWRPLADDGAERLLLGSRDTLRAIDAFGETLWEQPSPPQNESALYVMADAHQIYRQGGTDIIALDWETGEEAWRLNYAGDITCAQPESLLLQSTGQHDDGGWLSLYLAPTGPDGVCSTDFAPDPVTYAAAIDPEAGKVLGDLQLPGDAIVAANAVGRLGTTFYAHTADGMGQGLSRLDLTTGDSATLGLNQVLSDEDRTSGVAGALAEIADDTVILNADGTPSTLTIESWNQGSTVGSARLTEARAQAPYCLTRMIHRPGSTSYCIVDDITGGPEGHEGGMQAYWLGVADESGNFDPESFVDVPAPADLDMRGQAPGDAYASFPALIEADALESGNPAIVVPGEGTSVTAHDAVTGDELWSHDAGGDGAATQPFALPALGEVAYTFSRGDGIDTQILDAATGEEIERVKGSYNALDDYAGVFLVVNDDNTTRVRVVG